MRLAELDHVARLLGQQYLCEACHERYATELFDRSFVCSDCRRELEDRLVTHG